MEQFRQTIIEKFVKKLKDKGCGCDSSLNEEKEKKPYKGFKKGKNHPEGGLSRSEARRQGIHAGIETKDEAKRKGGFNKLSKKTQARRKSFCARMCGMKRRRTSSKTARDPKSKINAALRVWGCRCGTNESYESDGIFLAEGKNKPTNSKLWSRAKALARSKFKVYPSAYANAWASKWYKKKGGGWRSTVSEGKIDPEKADQDVEVKPKRRETRPADKPVLGKERKEWLRQKAKKMAETNKERKHLKEQLNESYDYLVEETKNYLLENHTMDELMEMTDDELINEVFTWNFWGSDGLLQKDRLKKDEKLQGQLGSLAAAEAMKSPGAKKAFVDDVRKSLRTDTGLKGFLTRNVPGIEKVRLQRRLGALKRVHQSELDSKDGPTPEANIVKSTAGNLIKSKAANIIRSSEQDPNSRVKMSRLRKIGLSVAPKIRAMDNPSDAEDEDTKTIKRFKDHLMSIADIDWKERKERRRKEKEEKIEDRGYRNLMGEEIVNPRNAGTMTEKEKSKRDRLAKRLKNVRPIRKGDSEKNAKYRYATYLILRSREGKGSKSERSADKKHLKKKKKKTSDK